MAKNLSKWAVLWNWKEAWRCQCVDIVSDLREITTKAWRGEEKTVQGTFNLSDPASLIRFGMCADVDTAKQVISELEKINAEATQQMG